MLERTPNDAENMSGENIQPRLRDMCEGDSGRGDALQDKALKYIPREHDRSIANMPISEFNKEIFELTQPEPNQQQLSELY
jgi:hypothetical protein